MAGRDCWLVSISPHSRRTHCSASEAFVTRLRNTRRSKYALNDGLNTASCSGKREVFFHVCLIGFCCGEAGALPLVCWGFVTIEDGRRLAVHSSCVGTQALFGEEILFRHSVMAEMKSPETAKSGNKNPGLLAKRVSQY